MVRPSLPVRIVAWAVLGFMLAPLAVIVLLSVSDRSYFQFPPQGFSLQWYARAWNSGLFLTPALRSLALAIVATALATALAVPGALGLRRVPTHRTGALELAFLLPLVVPQLILGIALLYAFSGAGLNDTFIGLVLAHTVIVFPFVFRNVLVSARALDPRQEEASALLGAKPLTTFRLVVLPALSGGITAGAILGFIVSFDQFTVSLLITQRDQITLPIAIYKYLYDANDPVAAAVSTVLVVVGFAVAVVVQRLGRLRNTPLA